MKTLCAILGIALACFGPRASAQDALSRVGGSIGDAHAATRRHVPQDILVNSKYYYAAHLEEISSDTATIIHRNGMTNVKWTDLSGSIQREYATEHNAAVAQSAQESQALRENSEKHAEGAEQIYGKVVSRIAAGGLLVQMGGRAVCLRGLPAERDLADGDTVPATWAKPDGTYSYTTAMGAAATVHAYRAVAARQ